MQTFCVARPVNSRVCVLCVSEESGGGHRYVCACVSEESGGVHSYVCACVSEESGGGHSYVCACVSEESGGGHMFVPVFQRSPEVVIERKADGVHISLAGRWPARLPNAGCTLLCAIRSLYRRDFVAFTSYVLWSSL